MLEVAGSNPGPLWFFQDRFGGRPGRRHDGCDVVGNQEYQGGRTTGTTNIEFGTTNIEFKLHQHRSTIEIKLRFKDSDRTCVYTCE